MVEAEAVKAEALRAEAEAIQKLPLPHFRFNYNGVFFCFFSVSFSPITDVFFLSVAKEDSGSRAQTETAEAEFC